MENLNEEINALIKNLLVDEDEVASAIAEQVHDIMEALEAGDIDEDMKKELIQDAMELALVEDEAVALETKIKVEAVFNLLVKLAKII